MAPASVALPFHVLPPPRLSGGTARPRSIRASSDTSGVSGGGRKAGALERRMGDLRALVASVPPAVASVRKNIGLNFVTGSCLGIAFLSVVARQIIIKSRERDNKGSVADLVRRGQLKSGQRGSAKLRTYDDPFNNPLVKIDEGTSTAQMFGKEYRLLLLGLRKNSKQCIRRDHVHISGRGPLCSLEKVIHYHQMLIQTRLDGFQQTTLSLLLQVK